MRILSGDVGRVGRAALVAALVAEGEEVTVGGAAVRALAAGLAGRGEWRGRFRDTLLLFGGAGGKEQLLLVGLGKAEEVDAEKVRRAAGIAFNKARDRRVKSLGVWLGALDLAPAETGNALAEGVALAAYRTPSKASAENGKAAEGGPREVRLGARRAGRTFEAGVERGVVVAEAANLARRLGDTPGNEMTPTRLAEEARRLAREARLSARIHRKADLARLHMGGILGVSQGSAEPPLLIELRYRPARPRRRVCLVGKGITFDTGGISIKPSAAMEEMKYDMCGGAAVLGTMLAAVKLALPVEIVGLVPAAENMPSGTAQKPGDVLVTASGLSVEVVNTDAEGRLVLADALHYAKRFEPDAIVDLATLTGACVIALGHDAAGLWSNDEGLATALKAAGEAAGDRAWPMPLFPEYRDDVKSEVADMKNTGKREGGAGSAAYFLSRFVEDVPWAHVDIAGTAWSGRARDYYSKGASGAGVRLLVRWLEQLR